MVLYCQKRKKIFWSFPVIKTSHEIMSIFNNFTQRMRKEKIRNSSYLCKNINEISFVFRKSTEKQTWERKIKSYALKMSKIFFLIIRTFLNSFVKGTCQQLLDKMPASTFLTFIISTQKGNSQVWLKAWKNVLWHFERSKIKRKYDSLLFFQAWNLFNLSFLCI